MRVSWVLAEVSAVPVGSASTRVRVSWVLAEVSAFPVGSASTDQGPGGQTGVAAASCAASCAALFRSS